MLNFDDMYERHAQGTLRDRNHCATVKEPSSFRQLLATGNRRKSMMNVKSDENSQKVLSFTQKVKETTFKKHKRAYENFHKSTGTASHNNELYKSVSACQLGSHDIFKSPSMDNFEKPNSARL